MSDILKTVIIKTENGPVIINECDFDTEKHELFVEKKSKTIAEKAPVINADNKFSVVKIGKGKSATFIVVDESQNPINDIEYATEAEAIAIAFAPPAA